MLRDHAAANGRLNATSDHQGLVSEVRKRGMLASAQRQFLSTEGKAMAQKKKLQVFVSSTYDDLKEERQAAVEAILDAGHIPAGMELFTAGDQSQMPVIKRWIDASDVFLLILGGRYGSIEPTSQKSYIHLEYEYALEKGKPLFAVVINEQYLQEKAKQSSGDIGDIIERVNSLKLKEFRDLVLTRLVKFWSDRRDIQLAIHGTMREFIDRSDVIGWIPASEAVNTGPALEEIARLTKENATLREQLANSSKESVLYNGLTFDEMCGFLNKEIIDKNLLTSSGSNTDEFVKEKVLDMLQNAASILEDELPSLLHLLWVLREVFFDRRFFHKISSFQPYIRKLENYKFLQSDSKLGPRLLELTDQGRDFLTKLMVNDKFKNAKNCLFLG
jgi:hypothetical protein